MLQDDFKDGAGQLGPEPFGRDESLADETDLNRATADAKAQNSVGSFGDGLTKDFGDVFSPALERLDSVPRRSPDITCETCENKHRPNH